MTTSDVKIPPDWLRTPNFEKRSELLDARKHERRALALALEPPPSCDKQFARSETIFRDSYRRSGAFERSPRQQQDPPPRHWHPRAICSGSPTKSALFARRQQEKRLESLKFEPPEIERLRDIPKIGQLEDWWKRPAPGYVEDPAFIRDSLRLQLACHGMELGPVDPAKTRSPASVDARRRLREKKAQLADKVTHISHLGPRDYARADAAIITRASELYPQQRVRLYPSGLGMAGGGGGGMGAETAWQLPVSPIKVPTKHNRSPRRAVENLFLESTSQRELLEQFKNWQRLSPPVSATAAGGGGGGALTSDGADTQSTATGVLLSPITASSESAHARSAFRDSVRCGGFS
ncbi:hypothetical protein BBJ28_00021450 [Nothophytophthora sp. Chile5]|nr:hypothetical protein BBJ28_00021450 [Nothophytophthora sp. Chile5]